MTDGWSAVRGVMTKINSFDIEARQCGMMVSIPLVGVLGNFLAEAPGPHLRIFVSANDPHTQFDFDPIGRSTVASQDCVTPGKTNGLQMEFDESRLLNPGNGLHDAEQNAYVPVNEKVRAFRAIEENQLTAALL
jgi:hypothetical protein